MKFETVTFYRKTRALSPIVDEVSAPACRGLALISPKRGHWDILHIVSGYSLTFKTSKTKAKAFILALLEAFPQIDWTQDEKVVYDACMDLGATHWIKEN